LLAADHLAAGPAEAFAADRDCVLVGAAVGKDVVKLTTARINDDGVQWEVVCESNNRRCLGRNIRSGASLANLIGSTGTLRINPVLRSVRAVVTVVAPPAIASAFIGWLSAKEAIKQRPTLRRRRSGTCEKGNHRECRVPDPWHYFALRIFLLRTCFNVTVVKRVPQA
jgi:hypothetical protein